MNKFFSSWRESGKSLWLCIFQIIAVSLILFFQLKLWHTSLRVPLVYQEDAVFFSVVSKAVSAENSFSHFSHLAAPFGLDFVDLAFGQYPDFFVIRFFQQIGMSFGLAFNLFWLSAIVLTSLLSSYFFKRAGLITPAAFALGILFAICPWTFYRHLGHLLFHLLYVPGCAYAMYVVGLDRTSSMSKLDKFLVYASLILISLNNVYYAFFVCAFLTFAWIFSMIQNQKFIVKGPSLFFGTVLIATFIGLLPPLLFWQSHGSSSHALNFKYPAEADIYALKLRHLLQPINGHPIHFLSRLNEIFTEAQFPLENENLSVRLGTVGSFGLLILLISSIGLLRTEFSRRREIAFMSAFAVFTLLVATVGGLGSFFNTLVSPQVRCYNRMAPFLTFFCFLVVGYLWTHAKKLNLRVSWIIAIVLVIFGAKDQIPWARMIDKYKDTQAQYQEEKNFVEKLEGLSAEPDMIFQLPFTEYHGDVGDHFKMKTYDQGRLYLHSKKTSWTFGTVTGTHGDFWERTEKLKPSQMVDQVLKAGFTGITIDLFGYKDDSLLRGISNVIGPPAVTSEHGRYVYFDVKTLSRKLIGNLSQRQKDFLAAQITRPWEVRYSGGYEPESDTKTTWRWMKSSGKIFINSHFDLPLDLQLKMTISHLQDGAQHFEVFADGKPILDENFVGQKEVTIPISLGPRQASIVKINYSGPRTPGDDPRDLRFRIVDLSVEPKTL